MKVRRKMSWLVVVLGSYFLQAFTEKNVPYWASKEKTLFFDRTGLLDKFIVRSSIQSHTSIEG